MKYTYKYFSKSKGPRPHVILEDDKYHDNYPTKKEAMVALKRYKAQIKPHYVGFKKKKVEFKKISYF